jgi:hypothetical protein
MRSQTAQKWVRGISVAVIGSAILVLLSSLLIPPDPIAHEKRLSEWLLVYSPTSSAGLGSPQRRAADQALRSLGDKAIPFLLHELQVNDSSATIWCYILLRRARLLAGPHVSAADRKIAVSRAFLALGPAASNAVPALVAVREQSRSLDSQCAVLYALAWIGPSAEAAIPILLRDAASANVRICAGALSALGEIRAQPELAVPVLMGALGSSNTWVQACAAHALGNFGATAAAAVAALSAMTNRIDRSSSELGIYARVEALNALSKIALAEQEQMDPLSVFSLR